MIDGSEHPAVAPWSVPEAADMVRAVLNGIPALIGYWDAGLRNRLANDAYLEFFGRTPDQMRGMHIRDVLGPDLFEQNRGHIERALAGERQSFDREIPKPNGEVAYTQASYIPDIAGGVVRGFFVLVTDITERHRIEAALHESEARYRTLVEQLPGGAITVVGPDLRLQWFGGRAADRGAVDATSMLGKLIRDAAGGGEHGLQVEDLYRRALGGEHVETEIYSRLMGRHFSFEVAPLLDPAGTVVAALGVAQDITERKRAEAVLELRSLIIDSMAEGAMLIREDDLTIVHANRTIEQMFGYDPGELAGSHVSVLNAGPDADPERTAEEVSNAVAGAVGPWTGYIHSVRRDGSRFWRRSRISTYDDEHGRLLVSVVSDVTDQRQREAEEQALSVIATLAAESVEAGAVLDEVARQVVSAFECARARVVRYDAETRRGHAVAVMPPPVAAGTHPIELDHSPDAAAAVWSTGGPVRSSVPHTGGEVAAPIVVAGRLWGCVTALYDGDPIPPDAEDRFERFTRLIAIAIANAEAWEALRRQAGTDALTGLANYRAFHDRLADEFGRASRYGRELSLVLIDLDHFKSINDTHGHQCGDGVLTTIAGHLADSAREGDFVARVGGEEFAWLMPETTGQGAHVAAERLRVLVSSSAIEPVGAVTLSAGIATMEHTHDAQGLIGSADAALYAAKDAGRNRVVIREAASR